MQILTRHFHRFDAFRHISSLTFMVYNPTVKKPMLSSWSTKLQLVTKTVQLYLNYRARLIMLKLSQRNTQSRRGLIGYVGISFLRDDWLIKDRCLSRLFIYQPITRASCKHRLSLSRPLINESGQSAGCLHARSASSEKTAGSLMNHRIQMVSW